MIRKWIKPAFWLGTGVVFAACAAAAQEVKVVNAGLDSVKVVKDKDTGKLRAATPDEAAAMASQPAQRLAPNVVVMSRPSMSIVSRADGSATVRRSLDDLDSVVAERNADGKLRIDHKGGSGKVTQ
jgi:hypothetical protein